MIRPASSLCTSVHGKDSIRVTIATVGFSLLFACAFLGNTAFGLQQPAIKSDASKLLQQCLSLQSRTDRVVYHVTTDERRSRIRDEGPDRRRGDFVIRRDGLRFDVAGRFVCFDEWEREESAQLRFLLNDELFLLYQFNFYKAHATKGAIVSRRPHDRIAQYLNAPYYGGPLDGYCVGTDGKRLAEALLAASQLEIGVPEVVGGTKLRKLSGSTPYGDISVVLDDDAVMHGFDYKKGPNHPYLLGKHLSEFTVGVFDGPKYESANSAFNSWRATLDSIVLADVEGIRVPKAGRLTVTRGLQDGRTMTTTFDYERTIKTLNPVFTGTNAFIPDDLPDNARLTNLDEPDSGIVFVWKDKAITTGLAGFESPLYIQPFSERRNKTQLWIVVSIIGLLIVGGIVGFRRIVSLRSQK